MSHTSIDSCKPAPALSGEGETPGLVFAVVLRVLRKPLLTGCFGSYFSSSAFIYCSISIASKSIDFYSLTLPLPVVFKPGGSTIDSFLLFLTVLIAD